MKRSLFLMISSAALACGIPTPASANDAQQLLQEIRLLASMEDLSIGDHFWHIYETTGSTETAFQFLMNHATLNRDLKWAMQSPMERLRELGLREEQTNS